uniref:Uncharacterized protein n=1 Tax=Lactuca sativa TaxID=4236 RepID=A0A9R1WHK3_LACSA|nr:hypothetical protein LSAT_V11C200076820 [Lactuca sativa]
MTWVSWKKVMAQKVHGGLRVSNLFVLNRAFIFNGFDVLFLLPLLYRLNLLWLYIVYVCSHPLFRESLFNFTNFKSSHFKVVDLHPLGGYIRSLQESKRLFGYMNLPTIQVLWKFHIVLIFLL